MTTPCDFARALLGALRLPVTENNIAALVAAQCIEGGFMHNDAQCNPLNTTLPAKGSRSVTAVHVQSYPDWATGLEATRDTLQNGLYGAVLASLAADAPPDDTLRAMSLSPWGWYRVVAGKRVPNPIGLASQYQGYGEHAFPDSDPPSELPCVPALDT